MLATASLVAQPTTPESSLAALKGMSFEELLNIEITSVSRRPESLLQAPSAIQVIGNDDIRRSGATNLPEALRLAGNLHVAQKGAHAWGISARGFNTELANKLLVLIDGRAVYTPLFSGVFWERQDYVLEDIDRIEVISGPGGSLWGANAVNGVINITTKSARDTQGLFVETGVGTELRNLTSVRYGGSAGDNVHYRVYGRYSDHDAAGMVGGGDAGDSWQHAQGGFRIDAATSQLDTLTVQGDLSRSRENLTTGGRADVTSGNLLGRWTRTFSADSNLSLQFYYDHTDLYDPVPSLTANGLELAPAGVFEDQLDTYDLDFQHTFRRGERHRIVWGLGYRFTRDKTVNAPPLGFLPERLDQDLFSGFLQDEIALVENIGLTLGSKIEHNDYTGTEFEPNVRLQWSPVANQTVWAAISRAVRTPSRTDRDLTLGTPPYFRLLRGDSDFASETVVAYELGHRAQLGPRVITSTALFYNEYDSVRSTSLDPVTIFPLFFQNDLEGETYGFEATADLQATDHWRLHASYTLLKQDLRIRPGGSDFNNALNETADPEQQISLRSSLDLPGNVEFDATLRWVDALPTNDAGVVAWVPDYTELDLRLAWHPSQSLEFSLVGQNLLNESHREYRVSNSPLVVIERNLFARVAWRF